MQNNIVWYGNEIIEIIRLNQIKSNLNHYPLNELYNMYAAKNMHAKSFIKSI